MFINKMTFWIMNDKQEKSLLKKIETSQMTFLRPLFGLTILDCQSNCDIWHRLKICITVEDWKAHK
jgi:hypothetical protein